jgi:hypothetical protein
MVAQQLGFSDYELTTANKQTKREKFLTEMEAVVPWQAGLIQCASQAVLPRLRAWVEVSGIAPSQCSKAFLPQPISI